MVETKLNSRLKQWYCLSVKKAYFKKASENTDGGYGAPAWKYDYTDAGRL